MSAKAWLAHIAIALVAVGCGGPRANVGSASPGPAPRHTQEQYLACDTDDDCSATLLCQCNYSIVRAELIADLHADFQDGGGNCIALACETPHFPDIECFTAPGESRGHCRLDD